MTHAVATEPERLMRRLPRNSRHGFFAHPTGALSTNSGRPVGREGGDGFTEHEAHASPMPAGTTHTAIGGQAGLARTAVPSGTSADQTAVADAPALRDGHGGRWRAPQTQNREV